MFQVFKRLTKTECFSTHAVLILQSLTIITIGHKTVESLFGGDETIKSRMLLSLVMLGKRKGMGLFCLGV